MNDDLIWYAKIIGTIGGWFVSFIIGIVTTTLLISKKLDSFVEDKDCLNKHIKCDSNIKEMFSKLENNLVRIHERIDDLYKSLGDK